jgi:chorismate mutase
MAQVRQCIDDLDMQIVALLAQRTSYMTQAARTVRRRAKGSEVIVMGGVFL